MTIFGVLFQLYTLSGGRDIYFSPEQPELSLPSSDSAVGTVSLTIVDPDTLEGEEHES